MDPVRNPYSPGAGAPPPALVGRDAELATCSVAIQRFGLGKPERSVLLTGLRGVGKTVLLREFGRLAEGHRWVHHAVEIAEELKFVEEMSALAHGVLRALSPGRIVVDRARRALGVLKSFRLKWKLPGEGDVVIGLDPVSGPADSGLLDHDLAGLLLEIGAVARDRDVGILVTIDEVQNLPREHLGALMVALHRVSQEQLPVMAAAAGLPTVPRLVGEAKTYAERLFHFRRTNSLADADARAALATPGDAEGVRWREAALDRVLAETRGYPYFIQEFGKHVGTRRGDRTRSRRTTWTSPYHAPPENWMQGSFASGSTGPAGRNRPSSPSSRRWEKRPATSRSSAPSRHGARKIRGSGRR